MSKIGGYQSYSYFIKDLPKETDNPAFFKASFTGPSATIYISCKLFKDKFDQWHILNLKQDSLIKGG